MRRTDGGFVQAKLFVNTGFFPAYFSPSDSGSLVWGAGPIVLLPTSTDDRLGGSTWGGGLSAVVLKMQDKWVYGGLISQVWDFGGSSDPAQNEQIDLLTIQPFVNYNLEDGWYVTAAPIWTRNGENSGDKWTVPLGGGAGKVFRVGRQPMNLNAQLFYNVEEIRAGAVHLVDEHHARHFVLVGLAPDRLGLGLHAG